MLSRCTESGRDQQSAEFVAVQGDGMRFIVDPRTPDMRGRGVLQELFLHRVAVEPGDGAQPTRNSGASPAPGLEFPGETLDVGAPDGEQGH